jgi:cytochrome b
VAILFLLGLGIATVTSGVMVYEDWGPSNMDRLHEWAADALFWMVGIHLLGVVVSSALHRENLVGAMIAGNKPGEAAAGVDPKIGQRAVWVLLVLIALAIWLG